MIINDRNLETVERERESYTLVNKKINNVKMQKQTGILYLYEDTG